jgi:hypothetical protein
MAARRPRSRPEIAFQDDTALLAPGAQRDQMLDQLKHMGGRFIRTNVVYNKWQDPAYRENLNSMVNAARARGIGVQMTLLGTPTYAPSARTDAVSAYHADPQQFGQWAGQVSKTFAGRVRRYSMWNEPRSSTFLADRSASRYRKLFEAGAGAVRGNVHNAQILLGELMPGYSGDPKSVGHALPFMQRMLAAGKKPLVADGLAVHPYAWMGEQPDGTSRGPNAYWGINQLGAVNKYLEQNKSRFHTPQGNRVPLYLTEFGYQQRDIPNDHVRAQRLRAAYDLATKAGAKEMTYYQVKPTTPQPGDKWWWDTGIADRKGRVRKDFRQAFQQMRKGA